MDGLSLRALEPEDLDLLVRWEADHADAGLRVAPYSRAVLSRYLEESHRDFWDAGQVRFVLCDPTGRAVGLFDLFNAQPVHQRAEVALLVDPSVRKQGLGKSGLLLVEQWAFGRAGLRSIYAEVFTDNAPALRVFASSGYQSAGVLKAWYRVGREFRDTELFQRLRS
ncbi:MAG: GNAT family N-acetyltransferase [Schleiferiaceae bacterium]|jgi:diamine N-acetyltransferase|nr:GNAT family N-acetyltransferase [Schleiferiaceae bacterium]MDP4629371.1 GNAT family N-acetyltransferase [Schleiferiaceae bacterium]MDP4742781.1 GNAT family N-acetyltransferase [Schleiferiaceae bacterium]MDP4774302.1 GNAT family N-acetyltransferase [Schleiferiaceae bacterium]MDP4854666.1 GNAT family N-acetyltransferase [Schleiferiaceae bacterium]